MPTIAEDKELTDYYKPTRYSQSALLQQHGQAELGGVCFLLCIHWILHHKLVRSTFGNKMSTGVRIGFLEGKEKFLTICSGHNEFLQSLKGKRGDAVAAELAHAKQYGVTLTDVGSVHTSPRYGRLGFEDRADTFEKAKCMTSLMIPHAYHIINLDGTHNHTICWYSSGNWFADNHLYIFDPNIGEFRTGATKAEAGAFLAKLVQEYGAKENQISRLNVYKAAIDTSKATIKV